MSKFNLGRSLFCVPLLLSASLVTVSPANAEDKGLDLSTTPLVPERSQEPIANAQSTQPFTVADQSLESTTAVDDSSALQVTPISDLMKETKADSVGQVTSVSQLSDVRPTDWAFQALQSLVERYGCIAGYPNGTFRGNRSATRYEMAAALNACLDQISDRFASKADLDAVKALQDEFAAELATLRGRVDGLESRVATVEAQQFSTTTKLSGKAVFLGQYGDSGPGGPFLSSVDDGTGTPLGAANAANSDSRASAISAVYLSFNTSFSGDDLLETTLFVGNGGQDFFSQAQLGDTTAGTPLTDDNNFSQYLNPSQNYFSGVGTGVSLYRLAYTFKPIKDLSVTVAPLFYPTDIIDGNSFTSPFTGFSTWFFVNNPLITPYSTNFAGGAGGGFVYNPGGGPLSFKGAYTAVNGFSPVNTGATNGGLFGDPYQATAEIEYAKTFGKIDGAVRLQYTNSAVSNIRQDAVGINAEAKLGKFGIFGRYGYSFANANGISTPVPFATVTQGRFDAQTWQAGLGVDDLLIPGSQLAAAVGMPFINNIGSEGPGINDEEQINIEAFYRFPVNDNITISPIFSAILNPNNSSAEPNLYQGLIRVVFSF
ncbi:MAG: iron uptake porin [Thermosynechococcaceae cyanobacterium]